MKRDLPDWLPGGGGLGSYILTPDKQLQAVDTLTWAHWMEAQRHLPVGVSLWKVGQNTVIEQGLVSTVFLGLDHGFGFLAGAQTDDYKPVVFETMCFTRRYRQTKRLMPPYLIQRGWPLRRRMHEHGQWRYTSWQEAEDGHRRAVKAYSASIRELEYLRLSGQTKRLEWAREALWREVQREPK